MKLYLTLTSVSSAFDDLFNPIKKALTPDVNKEIKHYIQESVKLEKTDRRLYFLKFLRYTLYKKLGLSGIQSIEKDAHLYTTRKTVDEVLHALVHAYELHLNAIDSLRLENQPVDRVLEEFDVLSKEAHKDSIIAIEEDDDVIKHYPDGFYWVKLDKPFCTKEGRAMGHCGNEPSFKLGDRIFSLRKKVKRGKIEFWESKYCTIIQDKGRYLGEIRGRFNEEPDIKLMPHILDLLSSHHFIGVMPSVTDYIIDTWNYLAEADEKSADKAYKANPRLFNSIRKEKEKINEYSNYNIEEFLKVGRRTLYKYTKSNGTTIQIINKYGNGLVSVETSIFNLYNGVHQANASLSIDMVEFKKLKLDKTETKKLVGALEELLPKKTAFSDQAKLLFKVYGTPEVVNKQVNLKDDIYDHLSDEDFKDIGYYKGIKVNGFHCRSKWYDVTCDNLDLADNGRWKASDFPENLTLNTLYIKGFLDKIPKTWTITNLNIYKQGEVGAVESLVVDKARVQQTQLPFLLDGSIKAKHAYINDALITLTQQGKVLKFKNRVTLNEQEVNSLPPVVYFGDSLTLVKNSEDDTLEEVRMPDKIVVKGRLTIEQDWTFGLPKDVTATDFIIKEESIEELPKKLKVTDWLKAENTDLRQLPRGLNVKVLNISNTAITALPKDLKVTEVLKASGTQIETLPEGITVNMRLVMERSSIRELPKGLRLAELNLRGCNNIKSLPEDIQFIDNLAYEGRVIDLRDTQIQLTEAQRQMLGSLKHTTVRLPSDLKYR